MKNKKITILLITAVAAVWGIIFYQVFISVKEESPMVTVSVKERLKEESLDDYRYKDTFKLKLDYRDPMLGKVVNLEEVAEAVESPISSVVIFQEPKPLQFQEDIKYKGYILGNTGKIIAAIISLNGKELMLAEGENNSGLKVLKNYRDSVKVKYKDQTSFIRLE